MKDFRTREIYVSHQTFRLLQMAGWLEDCPPDAVADKMLLEVLITAYPKLVELADERQKADARLREKMKAEIEGLKV